MIWNRKETRSPNRKAANLQEQASTHDATLPVVVATDIPVPLLMEATVEHEKDYSHAVVQSMLRWEKGQKSEKEEEGKNKMKYKKSTDG